MRSVCLAVLTTCSLACAQSCTESPSDWRAELASWKYPKALPSFPLVDERGRAFHLRDVDGPVVMGFVFTRCPVADACPLTMSRLLQVHDKAPALRIVVVTLDPAFDTSSVLLEYQQRFHADGITLATGDPAVIAALTSLFNVVAVTQGDDNIAHPVKLALLDRKLRPVHEWSDNNFQPQEIVDAASAQ